MNVNIYTIAVRQAEIIMSIITTGVHSFTGNIVHIFILMRERCYSTLLYCTALRPHGKGREIGCVMLMMSRVNFGTGWSFVFPNTITEMIKWL